MTFATSNAAAFQEIDAKIIQKAAEWHTHLHSDEAKEEDVLAFEEWRNQHPSHAKVCARMNELWARFDGLDVNPSKMTLHKVLKSRQDKSLASKAGSLVVLLVAGWLGLSTPQADLTFADYSTSTGEQRVIELADHSRITLNTRSAIDVEFSETQRRIRLRQGEVLIDVAKDVARPFIVETEHGSARALGTQYIVRRNANNMEVTVIESTVQACAAKISNCVNLSAGERTIVTQEEIQKPIRVDAQAATSWTEKMLVIDDQPLSEVLREIERYRHGSVYFDADKIANLHVSGVFSLDDTDRTLEVLAGTLPIRVKQYTPLLTVVKPL